MITLTPPVIGLLGGNRIEQILRHGVGDPSRRPVIFKLRFSAANRGNGPWQKWNRPIAAILAMTLLALSALARADDRTSMEVELHHIELEWALITYQMKNADQQEKEMRALADKVAMIVERYPNRAEPLIWQGAVIGSEAKYAGPFRALGLARRARELFEQAARRDYWALNGAVATSLGALFYMVPGFPLGFGDNDQARRYLEQAVEINPLGLDANFFYGDFLFREGEYAKAETALKRALNAPPDRERPVWDSGRRREIQTLLAKVDEQLVSAP